MKRYIWGFPGIGKSSLKLEGLNVIDADCRAFEFKNVAREDLHGAAGERIFERDESYPQNYLDFIKSVDADVVLINCHLSLLEGIDKDELLVVYPSQWLLSEYMERYVARGDNTSFVSYMATEAPGMIDYINHSDFNKYQIFTVNTYLADLFERKDFKMKVMTRKELTEQLQRAIDLRVIDTNDEETALVCDLSFVTKDIEHRIKNASTWAEAILDGKWELDIEQLLMVCMQREAEIEKEKVAFFRRGGLSREELENKIMQGIVNGALGIRYDQIAPYSHGYEVTFGGEGAVGSTWKFKNRWECYHGGFFDVPGKIVDMIENSQQDGRAFGNKAQPLDIKELLAAIDKMEGDQIKEFTPEKETDFERWGARGYGSRGSVASVMDVHKGKGLDGIVQHHYHGDYSSMTPSRQNDLVETLVFMKGFCLDCLSGHLSEKSQIVEYLKKHGTDISTPVKLQEWIKANPEKCGKEENRRILDVEIQKNLLGQAYSDVLKLNAIVNEFSGSFDDLCTKLSGYNWDGELFDLNFGVITATVENVDGVKFALNQKSVDIWDDSLTNMVKESIPVIELKALCKQLGVEVENNVVFEREGFIFNDEQKLCAQAYCDFVELKAVVDSYQHSYPCAFDKLCRELGGDRYDDNIFKLDYGVIAVSVTVHSNGDLYLNESAIGVWDKTKQEFLNDCMSLKQLKETCEEIGFDTKELETQVLGDKIVEEKPGLDTVIKSCETMSKDSKPNPEKGSMDKER